MKKFQLFTRKPGQLAVGNKYAIYSTLAEAQEELREWFVGTMNDNVCIDYLDDSIVAEDELIGIEYLGYKGAGWYMSVGDGVVNLIFLAEHIQDDDFTEFSYDLTKYFIEEIEVENER